MSATPMSNNKQQPVRRVIDEWRNDDEERRNEEEREIEGSESIIDGLQE
jgi:hypothetical protein